MSPMRRTPVMASAAFVSKTTVTNETALIRQVISGRRDLFADLIAPHLSHVRRTVLATMDSHADADDIVQQAALKALIHLDQFRFEASFKTWLIQIAFNEVRQWRRKLAISRFTVLDPAELTRLPDGEAISPLVECQKSETKVKLDEAIARLPEKYRVVLLLRDLESLTNSEVASQLGLTVPAVKTRHLRARRIVAKLLGRGGSVGN